ncbi:hypothetical protein HWV62_31847 [Athelia sp. TMB]|nr:hypothetical protein HWV62_31847 [Athelia sp. TMB]
MRLKEWASVLKLSMLWEFGNLRRETIEGLVKMKLPPVDKVFLGREYHAGRLLMAGYEELIKRDAGLSSVEKKPLGEKDVLKIYEAREKTVRKREPTLVRMLVEATLFKVPRYKLEENSSVFKDMFAIAQADTQEGYDDDKPIRLDSVERIDFQRFLTALIPDRSSELIKDVRDHWVSVLKLSTLWDCFSIRKQAIKNLDAVPIEPEDKVALARAYRVQRWVIEGYSTLVRQELPFTVAQKVKLGAETIIRLYERREETFRAAGKAMQLQLEGNFSHFGSSPTPNREFSNLDKDLIEIFQEEYKDARYDGDDLQDASVPYSPVENELFKVPKFYFENESSVFHDMFQMPSSGAQEGNSAALPIVLESIKKSDFIALLTAMFPEQVIISMGAILADIIISLSKRATVPIHMGEIEWGAVLKLSMLWEFSTLRRMAIEEVSHMDSTPVVKVVLGRDYHVKTLLEAGYRALISRNAGLSDEEKVQLGDKASMKIYEARERTVRTGRFALQRGFNEIRNLESVTELVQDEFGAELRDAQGGEDV